MNNTGTDIAISALNKLIDQELAAMRATSGKPTRNQKKKQEDVMTGESQLDFETKYLQDESIQVSTDKTITQIASDAYVQGFIAGRLKPPTEIEIEAALRYLTTTALIRQDTTYITVSHALADMCREMRYALTKRTTKRTTN